MVKDIVIRPAELEDIPSILDIQSSCLLKNKPIKLAEKEGFLVYPIKDFEVEEIVFSKNPFFIVAEDNGNIVGYALAYDLNDWGKIKQKWDKRILVTSQIKNHLFSDRVLYFRHIARMTNYSGVGEKLEEQIYSIAKNNGFKFVVGEILEKPLLNKKSKELHEERGFIKIGQVDYLDGNFWGLYEKKLD